MRVPVVLTVSLFVMLYAPFSCAAVVSSDCPNHPEAQAQIQKLETDIFKSQGAVIAGHADKVHDKYVCVNGFKIYPADHMVINVGKYTYKQFDKIWPNAYVEISASLDREGRRLLADEVSVQFSLVGYIHKFVHTAGTFKIMYNPVKVSRRIDPLCLGEMDVAIVSGLRTPDEDMHVIASLVRFGELVDMRNLGWSVITGIIREKKELDDFGVEMTRYYVGKSRLKATDMDKITGRLGQHVALYGVWSRDMAGDVLDVSFVKETPLTVLYNHKGKEDIFFSIEQYLAQKDGVYSFYDLPVDEKLARSVMEDDSQESWEDWRPFIAYGLLSAGGNSLILALAESGKVNSVYSQFDRGWPLPLYCFTNNELILR